MRETQLKIIALAQKEVAEIFGNKVDSRFVFHTLKHTTEVADAAGAIANFYQFDDNDKFTLAIAAWFHDTGFSSGRIEGHEIESAKIAETFLHKYKVDCTFISGVTACIQATKMPQRPVSGIDKVICDADLFHLGTKHFDERTELLRQELQFYYKADITEKEWGLQNIEFLKSHHYFTGYCQQMLEPVKQQWIIKLEKGKQKNSGKRMHTVIWQQPFGGNINNPSGFSSHT